METKITQNLHCNPHQLLVLLFYYTLRLFFLFLLKSLNHLLVKESLKYYFIYSFLDFPLQFHYPPNFSKEFINLSYILSLILQTYHQNQIQTLYIKLLPIELYNY